MPYIFAVLVALNVALFAYFWFVPSQTGDTLEQKKAQVQSNTIRYVNNSKDIPPPIGKK